MPDAAPNPELLRSLGRLARGLSALFWGLPAALIVTVRAATSEWLPPWIIIPVLALNGLLIFGLWQLGAFQMQERPWRFALDRAKLLALTNLGLSPFVYWANRVPGQAFFSIAVLLLVLSGLLFLFNLNLVLARLGAMLPDETLRQETKQFTALNRWLLVITLALLAAFVLITRMHPQLLDIMADLAKDPAYHRYGEVVLLLLDRLSPWLILILVLLPLSLTMALIWKTKEVILESVFGAPKF